MGKTSACIPRRRRNSAPLGGRCYCHRACFSCLCYSLRCLNAGEEAQDLAGQGEERQAGDQPDGGDGVRDEQVWQRQRVWRAGNLTSTVREDSREEVPAAQEVELSQGEGRDLTRVVSMTAGRLSGTQHIEITRLRTTLTQPHRT